MKKSLILVGALGVGSLQAEIISQMTFPTVGAPEQFYTAGSILWDRVPIFGTGIGDEVFTLAEHDGDGFKSFSNVSFAVVPGELEYPGMSGVGISGYIENEIRQGVLKFATLAYNLDVSPSGAFDAYLDTNQNIGKDGTSVYFSFLIQLGRKRPSDIWEAFTTVDFFRDGWNRISQFDFKIKAESNLVLFIGANKFDDKSDQNVEPGLYGVSIPTLEEFLSFDYNEIPGSEYDLEVHLIVMRFDFGAGDDDTLHVYWDPDLSKGEPAVADLIVSGKGDLSFDRMAVLGGGTENFVTSPDTAMDDLLFFTEWGDLQSSSEITWAGYPVDENGWVATEEFMGFLQVSTPPWVYVWSLGKYIYLSEELVSESGAWTYIP